MTKQVQKKFLLTPEEDNALANLRTLTGDKTDAGLLRRLLAEECAKHGLTWPDNMPTKSDNAKKGMKARWGKKEG